MNRTNSFREFLSDNRRLLLFLALLLLGRWEAAWRLPYPTPCFRPI